jgi:pimeloyl-ACP methyl ester carboxylesterase
VSERGFSVLPIYDRGLDNAAAVQEAAICVERATGPLLLVSGGDDRVWPAERMCRMVVERMRLHGRADDVDHLNYPDAGHFLFRTGGRPAAPRHRPWRSISAAVTKLAPQRTRQRGLR